MNVQFTQEGDEGRFEEIEALLPKETLIKTVLEPLIETHLFTSLAECVRKEIEIYRAYGASAGMVCPHGCYPEGGYLSDAEERALLLKIQNLLGGLESVFTVSPEDFEKVLISNGLPPMVAKAFAQTVRTEKPKMKFF